MQLLDRATGVMTQVTVGPSALPGLEWAKIGPNGIAVNHAIDTCGVPSDGQNRPWGSNFPNPGG